MNHPFQNHKAQDLILSLSSRDKPGIVASVSTFFAEHGFNIKESSQFEDSYTKRFFMRAVFEVASDQCPPLGELKGHFQNLACDYGMSWEIHPKTYLPKVLIAVSEWGHCLNHLLNQWKSGDLPVDIVGVVSNHTTMQELVEWYRLPFHHFPVTPETKSIQEAKILALMELESVDLLVLARYMQILSNEMCEQLTGRAINIHHSFLPGFKGAKPYHQAFDRGVKQIGATAHYVTAELDEGPIIEQAVERVTHVNTPEELVAIGRDIESVVLSRAVRWHAQHRVLLNGQKTVVFSR